MPKSNLTIVANDKKAFCNNAKFLGFSEDDQTIATHVAYVDGYHIGDRLLENVMFRCEVVADGLLEVTLTPDADRYFKSQRLDRKSWLEAMCSYAVQDCDTFAENEDGSGRDFGLVPINVEPSVRAQKPPPVKIKIQRPDFLGSAFAPPIPAT